MLLVSRPFVHLMDSPVVGDDPRHGRRAVARARPNARQYSGRVPFGRGFGVVFRMPTGSVDDKQHRNGRVPRAFSLVRKLRAVAQLG